MKKTYVLLAVCLLSCLIFTACGSSSTEPAQESAPEATTISSEPATEPAPEATTEEAPVLSDEDCFEIVFDDAPVNSMDADNQKIRRNLDGTIVVSFSSVDGEYAYTLDSHTGEILDKKMPDKITTNSSDAQSFDEDAVFDALKEVCPVDYVTGENLKIRKSSDGTAYEVSFNTPDGEYFYKFDKETMEVLEKREPENITDKEQAGAESKDSIETAITECCEYADTNPGEVKDIKIKEVGSGDSKTYQVTFIKGDKTYDLVYDPATGKVTEN